jgi:hypothetical protein
MMINATSDREVCISLCHGWRGRIGGAKIGGRGYASQVVHLLEGRQKQHPPCTPSSSKIFFKPPVSSSIADPKSSSTTPLPGDEWLAKFAAGGSFTSELMRGRCRDGDYNTNGKLAACLMQPSLSGPISKHSAMNSPHYYRMPVHASPKSRQSSHEA